MGIVLQIMLDVCMCCKSTASHDPAGGKSVSDYPSHFDQRTYSLRAEDLKKKIPNKWKCGKCNKINKKGREHCIYCDEIYNPSYRITDESKQGEDSHFVNDDKSKINDDGENPNQPQIIINPSNEHQNQNSIDYASMEEALDDIPLDSNGK